jgi:hypothetical protein
MTPTRNYPNTDSYPMTFSHASEGLSLNELCQQISASRLAEDTQSPDSIIQKSIYRSRRMFPASGVSGPQRIGTWLRDFEGLEGRRKVPRAGLDVEHYPKGLAGSVAGAGAGEGVVDPKGSSVMTGALLGAGVVKGSAVADGSKEGAVNGSVAPATASG